MEKDELETVVINGKEVKLKKGEMLYGPRGRGYTRISNIFQVISDEALINVESEFIELLELIRAEKKRKKIIRLSKKTENGDKQQK